MKILWCEAHKSQVIQTWNHPLLSDYPTAAWCDVGDWLRDRNRNVFECSITQAEVRVGVVVED